ncbi:MAG: hypothetical protein ABI556_17745 [Gemmatimonadales bacterium]
MLRLRDHRAHGDARATVTTEAFMVKPLLAMLFMYLIHDVVFEQVERASLRMKVVQSADTTRSKECSSSEHRQFDFWIGDWDVLDEKGLLSGTNTVTPILGGCVLKESWKSDTEIGESFNIYDTPTRQWHQTWVDSKGREWVTAGGIRSGAMVLTRTSPGKTNPKETILHRWTWTKVDANNVRQLYDASKDDGKTWQVFFDGRYRRKSG